MVYMEISSYFMGKFSVCDEVQVVKIDAFWRYGRFQTILSHAANTAAGTMLEDYLRCLV